MNVPSWMLFTISKLFSFSLVRSFVTSPSLPGSSQHRSFFLSLLLIYIFVRHSQSQLFLINEMLTQLRWQFIIIFSATAAATAVPLELWCTCTVHICLVPCLVVSRSFNLKCFSRLSFEWSFFGSILNKFVCIYMNFRFCMWHQIVMWCEKEIT